MADYPLVGGKIACGNLRLLAHGLLKSPKLVDRKDNEKRLKQDDCLSQASVEIVVVRTHLLPKVIGMERDTVCEVTGCHSEIFAQILDHFLQCVDLMEELEPLGEKHAVQEDTHARRTLALMPLIIGRVQGRGVGNCSVVFGVFAQSAEHSSKRAGQQFAQLRSHAEGSQGFRPESPET